MEQIENTLPVTNIEDTFTDFYFLIYTANPNNDTVKVWVDGNRLRLLMKRDKFYSLIKKLCGYNLSEQVHETCLTYGCFFELNRSTREIKKLHPTSERKFLNPSKEFVEENKRLQKSKNDMTSQYNNSMRDWVNSGIKANPFINSKIKNR